MFGKILNFLDKVLSFFEEWTLFISVLVALIALFFNVVLRYGFNYSLAWSEDSLIRIDASVQLLPKLKIPLTFFSNFVVMIFAIMMIYYGWLMAALQVQTQQKTIIMQIPLVYLYAILPLMGIMMLIRVVQVFYQDIQEQLALKTRD
jgi:TRAP-type C4-dicarboxylate transport system permease small subunit